MSSGATPTQELHVGVERYVFVRSSGAAEDCLTVTFTNQGNCEVALDCCLAFRYRDSSTEFVSARDLDGTWIPPVVDRLETHDDVLVMVNGGVQTGGQRSVAVKVMRHDLVRVVDDALFLTDPLYALSMPGLPVGKVRFCAAAVFPEGPYRRRLVADGAEFVTSRVAAWDWGNGSSTGANLHMRVHQEPAALSGAPRRVDDAIAEVYGLRAASVMGEWPEMAKLNGQLSHPSIQAALPGGGLPSEDEFVRLPHRERDAMLRDVLGRLRTVRQEILQVAGCSIHDDPDALARAERIYREIEAVVHAADRDRVPDDTGEALLHLLQYQATQRARPTRWSLDMDEAEFQDRLEEFLMARQVDPGREVRAAGGRCDFLLGKTPVELKVTDLKGNPEAEVAKHLNQAAEYAASLGSAAAVLMVLDEYRYPPAGSYLPAPDNQVRVDAVESEPGATGRTRTAVVSIVVPGFPPRPSRMGMPTTSSG